MTAASHNQERERVMLPGYSFGIGAPSVATATEEQLRKCLEKDLTAIAHVMEQEAASGLDVRPTKEGLAPPEWHEYARKNRGKHSNLAAIEGIERRILAIRAELPRREALHKLDVKSKSEETRRRLEGVVEHAPVHASNLYRLADQVAPAYARLKRIVDDLQLVAGTVPHLAAQYSALRRGAEQAAEALGVPSPQFDPLPELPSQADVLQLLTIISGRHEGFDRTVPSIGDAAKVRDLVRELKK